MNARVIRPAGRGFLYFDSHPAGCARFVDRAAQEAVALAGPGTDRAPDTDAPVALIIGSSSGYGLAATLTGLAAHGIRGIAVCHERPARGSRTATAGWYRTARTAQVAERVGTGLTFVNADCFTERTRTEVLDLLERRHGRVDHLVYSVAAPRRTDPATGRIHESVLKPLGAPCLSRAVSFDAEGRPRLTETVLQAATDAERDATVAVMGGADWQSWVTDVARRGLAGPRFRTVALSYLGAEPTAAIYRQGTIGAAKEHLEHTARALNTSVLAGGGGQALVSVNGAAFTQASVAIPGMALYLGLLRRELGDAMQSPVRQSHRLWGHLTGTAPLTPDEAGRVRLDDWELRPEVQAAVMDAWRRVTEPALAEEADLDWLTGQLEQLHGFGLDGVDYTAPVDPHVPWPTPAHADAV